MRGKSRVEKVETLAASDATHRGIGQSGETVMRINELLDLWVCALVDKPEDVEIKSIYGRQTVVYEVSVHSDDIRRLVGRKGRTVGALRELLFNVGAKVKKRFLLEIIEPGRSFSELGVSDSLGEASNLARGAVAREP